MQTLPRTLYLWLTILAASILLGERLPSRTPEKRTPTAQERLTGPDFDRYLDAERNLRFYYSGGMLSRGESLDTAAKNYRAIAKTIPVPNLARRALILDAQQKKPLDSALLTTLEGHLKSEKVAPAEIAAELALWKALYGKDKKAPLPPDALPKVKAMHLRFLESQALADVAHRQGDTKAAHAAETQRDSQAKAYTGVLLPLIFVMFMAGLAGVGLLFLVGICAVTKQWRWLGKVESAEAPKLGWAELIDSFVFYLALYRGIGLALAFTVRQLHLHPAIIPIQLLLQGGTGLAAIAYLAVKAKRCGATLESIGWSKKNLGINALYGVAGYAATLPLNLVFGLVAHAIFRNNVDTTPNPVLPLLAAPGAFWERGLIFLMAAGCAPLFEEFFFRGALLTGLRQRFGSILGLIFSAVAFAVVHPTQDWIPIFGLGMSFGLMRHLRQSLVPGMVAHFLQNSLAFLMLTALFTD